ncbi:rRNA methyltransferase [Corynebacterium sp. HMSC072B08]|uniref:TrmH family RNA methyltransferase n=1 Tax=Corynebacterium TaxID=1716 RepID=UPI000847E43C|nr:MULTISPECIES: RNA methyltransferase [Corynebacterium]MBC6793617.1 RNA methyltransferase [Corynebacterium sp. LK26]MDC7119612.1 RNA methyltransferase [Corynebacterium amycolatum]ODQ39706.1 rRNA methyltransferase [Corynebacterium amycolatum]OFO24089.1 rRNA methyltransferase [Corynebacterium sp. HMSC064E07]OHQ65196.1 rRNA methyltransferase [Corynebacterium sp. HMSC072B08]
MSTNASLERFAPIVVDDPADSRLDDIRNLNKSDSRPDLPGGKGLVIAEGTLIVPRLVRSRFPLRAVFGTRQKLASLADGLTASEAAIAETVPWFELDREVLAAAAGFDLHRGLLATADRAPELSVDQVLSGATTLAVMEGVGDHENIGALFRNAAGMGVDGVVFGAACADPLYRRSVRVSMGHVLTVPFATLPGTTTTWQRSLDQLKEQGFRVVSMTPAGTVDLWDAMDTDKVAILVGAEGQGLTEHAMAATDVRARIPMSPGTDSLNVATSAAIAFYERLRVQSQRAGR